MNYFNIKQKKKEGEKKENQIVIEGWSNELNTRVIVHLRKYPSVNHMEIVKQHQIKFEFTLPDGFYDIKLVDSSDTVMFSLLNVGLFHSSTDETEINSHDNQLNIIQKDEKGIILQFSDRGDGWLCVMDENDTILSLHPVMKNTKSLLIPLHSSVTTGEIRYYPSSEVSDSSTITKFTPYSSYINF